MVERDVESKEVGKVTLAEVEDNFRRYLVVEAGCQAAETLADDFNLGQDIWDEMNDLCHPRDLDIWAQVSTGLVVISQGGGEVKAQPIQDRKSFLFTNRERREEDALFSMFRGIAQKNVDVRTWVKGLSEDAYVTALTALSIYEMGETSKNMRHWLELSGEVVGSQTKLRVEAALDVIESAEEILMPAVFRAVVEEFDAGQLPAPDMFDLEPDKRGEFLDAQRAELENWEKAAVNEQDIKDRDELASKLKKWQEGLVEDERFEGLSDRVRKGWGGVRTSEIMSAVRIDYWEEDKTVFIPVGDFCDWLSE